MIGVTSHSPEPPTNMLSELLAIWKSFYGIYMSQKDGGQPKTSSGRWPHKEALKFAASLVSDSDNKIARIYVLNLK